MINVNKIEGTVTISLNDYREIEKLRTAIKDEIDKNKKKFEDQEKLIKEAEIKLHEGMFHIKRYDSTIWGRNISWEFWSINEVIEKLDKFKNAEIERIKKEYNTKSNKELLKVYKEFHSMSIFKFLKWRRYYND